MGVTAIAENHFRC